MTAPATMSAPAAAYRLPLLLLGMLALVLGVLAGLARLGVPMPAAATAQAGNHGALMIAAFLGTVISLERAVAVQRTWAYLAPLCAGLGGLALVMGWPLLLGQALFVAAGSLLVGASGLILGRQFALHLATLALGAAAWLAGSVVWFVDGAIVPAVPWWMAFLVLTIAGERLELTRLMPPSAGARAAFAAITAFLLLALLATLADEVDGLRLVAVALLALALWLLRQDVARRTVRQSGLTRYIAACLLAGYFWLAFAGLLGLAGGFALGSALRDPALHAVFLGFVFSMIFGHAPVIIPAVARQRVPYHASFYVPFAVLHVSLLARIAGDLIPALPLARAGALGNAAALLLFVASVVAAVLRGRRLRATEVLT